MFKGSITMNTSEVNNISCCSFQVNECDPFTLIIGVICGSVIQMTPLLISIKKLINLQYLKNIEIIVLANGESIQDVSHLVSQVLTESTSVSFQVLDGQAQEKILPIGEARSLLQKAVGIRMEEVHSSYAWILDDDMSIPNIASKYLSWLPAFKSNGLDVLIGSFNGGSPNPPAHGLRIQINDLIHNIRWLSKLIPTEPLPDRSQENAIFRKKYPDYYYDLSRKHDEHLVKPYWVVPHFKGETVDDAYQRILSNLTRIFTGEPFLRPLISDLPCNPLLESYPSCNRGGNTFILSSKTLTLTPNITTLTAKKENRRSDMVWAIINRFYHGFNVHAVSFPIDHHRYIGSSDSFSMNKSLGEIKGAALYAALLAYFEKAPNTKWQFTSEQINEISDLYCKYINKRIASYNINFRAIGFLLEELDSEFSYLDLKISLFINTARKWVDVNNLKVIRSELEDGQNLKELTTFLNSISQKVDDF